MQEIGNVAFAGLIVGLVQVAKNMGLKNEFAPILAIVLGVGLSFLTTGTIAEKIIGGVVVGLSAVGLYSGAKATAQI